MRLPATGVLIMFLTVFFLPRLLPGAGPPLVPQSYSKSPQHPVTPCESNSVTGSEFLRQVAGLDEHQREQVILDTLLQGHLPKFLWRFKPVNLNCTFDSGRTVRAVFFVMPDYLAIGTDADFVRMPMNLRTAGQIAAKFHCILPTPKMVDAIYAQSAFHYNPQPMPPGPQMRSTAYYIAHNRKIRAQRVSAGISLDKLVSGHKKDVVITNRLLTKSDRIAIYGWHRHAGDPIQPLSTVHGAGYADYSHGIRLVSDTVLINGKPRSLCEVLQDPRLAQVFSDEGVIRDVRWILRQPSRYFSQHAQAHMQHRTN